MDLECRQETMERWAAVSRLKIEREVSGETIVPDTCPDVGAILTVRPRIFLQRKEAMEGRGEFSGLVRAAILYRPEDGGGPAVMETALPFTAGAEDPGFSPGRLLWTRPGIVSAQVHLLNSRKLLLKVVYRLEVTVYAPGTETFLSLVEDPLPWGIRQRTETLLAFFPQTVQEKTFTCQETMTLPAGQPDPAEILTTQARCRCGEARVLGDKLLFKGEAILELLCGDGLGELFPVRFTLPFSQVMEGETQGEICRVSLLVDDLTVTRDPDDPRTFHGEVTVTAQGEVFRTVETPVLADLYSTTHQVEAEGEALSVQTLRDRDEAAETGRVLLPWPEGTQGGACRDLEVRLGPSTLGQEEGKLLLTQQIRVSALCMGEEGPLGLEGSGEIVHTLEGGEGDLCLWMAEILRDPSAQETPQGLEVTVPLTFRWLRLEEGMCPVIRRVTVGEKLDNGEERPSLVIRAVGEGQTLWDVAKASRSSQEDIMAASGLTSEELYPGQMLLIPRSAV